MPLLGQVRGKLWPETAPRVTGNPLVQNRKRLIKRMIVTDRGFRLGMFAIDAEDGGQKRQCTIGMLLNGNGSRAVDVLSLRFVTSSSAPLAIEN